MSDQGTPQLRLRVFAGPNGSGKSTVIKSIRETQIGENTKLDIGVYINADDIAQNLKNGDFSFHSYDINCKKEDLIKFGETSGLFFREFTKEQFTKSLKISDQRVLLFNTKYLDRTAQLIARFLRHALMSAKKRFSFETVFSHESNLDDMRVAAKAGYKVYLYFVGTESPEINKFRVELRVKNGGHNVPIDRIENRYVRSMELLKQAIDIAYQAYLFDNSINGEPYRLVGHFKVVAGVKEWDDIPDDQVSLWLKKYYPR